MNRDIRKLIKKVDELQKQLNQQNESIMDQSIIIQKLIEKLVAIPSYPYPSTPSIDPHFVKDEHWVPYKGPETTTIRGCGDNVCGNTSTTNLDPNIKVYNNRTTTPITFKSYDGTMSTLPVNTLPEDKEDYEEICKDEDCPKCKELPKVLRGKVKHKFPILTQSEITSVTKEELFSLTNPKII